MILVSRKQFEQLKEANLINFSRYERNFTIVNRQKKGCRKKYYVVESRKIMNFLNENKQ